MWKQSPNSWDILSFPDFGLPPVPILDSDFLPQIHQSKKKGGTPMAT